MDNKQENKIHEIKFLRYSEIPEDLRQAMKDYKRQWKERLKRMQDSRLAN